jgi:hypothetical protein
MTLEELTEQYYEGEPKPTIGIYGRARQTFLLNHRQKMYLSLLKAFQLYSHLEEIDKEANERQEQIIAELAKSNNVNEQMKAEDMMKWVGLMNNFQSRARELVMDELIHA